MLRQVAHLRRDPILRAFLEASDLEEQERQRSLLVIEHASPVVKQVISQRLRVHSSESGFDPHNPEAADIYSDVIVRTLEHLDSLLADPHGKTINDFRSYVARIAHNACNDYARRTHPARRRLHHRILRLLDRHPDFASWGGLADPLCGYAVWHGQQLIPSVESKFEVWRSDPAGFARECVRHIDMHDDAHLADLVSAIFDEVRGPVVTDALVDLIAGLRGLTGQLIYSYEAEIERDPERELRVASSTLSFHSVLEMREIVALVWREVCRLPSPRREAFVLSFKGENGEDFITLLIATSVATEPDIAREIGMTHERLNQLRNRLPMNNQEVAAELGATPQQVNKWRWLIFRQLEKILTGAECK